MKRKSILMTIVAALFAGVAWGQTIPLPTSLATGVKGSDTIFFCANADSLYPIEFGYDVSGRRLHPSYGDWHLLAKTSSTVTVDDYQFDPTIKNEGAGNAFRAVGSGIGGILFEYTAKDEQCGLLENEKYWVYVFILPEENKTVTTLDTFLCYKESALPVTIKFSKVFEKYVNLYAQAGLTASWLSGNNGLTKEIKLDSVASYALRDTLKITIEPGYSCGDTIPFLYQIRVDSIARDTIARAYSICASDTIGDMGKRDVNLTYFKRNLPNGAYNKTTVGSPWVPNTNAPNGSTKKIATYTYTYYDCKAPSKPHTIVDTLKIIDNLGNDAYLGIDTVNYCRVATGSVPVIDFYAQAWYLNKPNLSNTDSYWADRGTKDENSPSPSSYGTESGTSSLIGGYDLNLDDMGSSIGYYYRWNVDASVHTCFTDNNGKPGWGTLVVILQDPFVAQDYTAQLCKESYLNGDKFNLNTYANLPAVSWSGTGLSGSNITPYDLDKSTYKYKYEASGDCATGKGVFYIKITSKVRTPSSKTVKYCLAKLPSQINLNDVLGVAVKSLTWSSSNSLTVDDGFDASLGILDIGKYIKSKGRTATELTFVTATGSSTCGVPTGIVLKIDLVNNL
ncbi:MAG: hypothetical protein LBG17_00770 [Bacteroidales bacterium]|jgi:hypothetical protein|nr:hypothetical protein [Bacteroidales bacterium]